MKTNKSKTTRSGGVVSNSCYVDFGMRVIREARKTVDWYKAKQRPSCTPKFMSLPTAYRVLQEAKNCGIEKST